MGLLFRRPYQITQLPRPWHLSRSPITSSTVPFRKSNRAQPSFHTRSRLLLRRGIELPPLSEKQALALQKKLACFKERDFKVKLGSILEGDIRGYYAVNGFRYLEDKLGEE